jgi:N6-L-threonylcarbamoyladenine synthase
MITLGIETSCDETSCAVLKGKEELLSNIISSSLFRHKPFGGVVPEIASRHCLEQIDVVYQEALEQAKITAKDIDVIAVTEGPGLIGSLLVGISFAKALAYQLKKPLIGVNHLDAHLIANFIGKKEPAKYIGLLVSGGHTSISYHEKGKVKLLGSTVDDAVGEAYDKSAKIMGLGYPGGPVMDKLAQKGNADTFQFTKPKQKGRFDFSYSGIKTAVLYKVQNEPKPLSETFVENMAASFQKAAVGWLVEKTLDAADSKKVKDIVVGGGVSANSELRKSLTSEGNARGFEVHFPPFLLTMDNAGMIARRGCELFKQGKRSKLSMTGSASLKMGKSLTSKGRL